MNRARALLPAALFAVTAFQASGQTSAGPTNATGDEIVRHGPVIMPYTSATPTPSATVDSATPPASFQAAPPGQPPSPSPQPPSLNPTVANGVAPAAGPGPKGDEIYDIRPPLFFLHPWLWIVLALLLAALVLVGLVILLWRWFATRSVLSPKTAYDLALEKLEKARLLLHEDDPAPYAVAVSEAIRTYLAQRFLSPTTHRTTDEFLLQMEADPGTPLAAHRDLLRDFLQACDLLKFARYHPTAEELEQVHKRAVTFVTATKPVPVSAPTASGQLIPRTT